MPERNQRTCAPPSRGSRPLVALACRADDGMAQPLDTPRILKSDGFSGNAHGNPSRLLLKGPPMWTVDPIARRALLNQLWRKWSARVPKTLVLLPVGAIDHGARKHY